MVQELLWNPQNQNPPGLVPDRFWHAWLENTAPCVLYTLIPSELVLAGWEEVGRAACPWDRSTAFFPAAPG